VRCGNTTHDAMPEAEPSLPPFLRQCTVGVPDACGEPSACLVAATDCMTLTYRIHGRAVVGSHTGGQKLEHVERRVKSRQVKSSQAKLNQAESSQVKSSHAESSQVESKSSQVESNQIQPSPAQSNPVHPNPIQSSPVQSSQFKDKRPEPERLTEDPARLGGAGAEGESVRLGWGLRATV